MELRELRDKGLVPNEVMMAVECFIRDQFFHGYSEKNPEPSLKQVLDAAVIAWSRAQAARGGDPTPPEVPPDLDDL